MKLAAIRGTNSSIDIVMGVQESSTVICDMDWSRTWLRHADELQRPPEPCIDCSLTIWALTCQSRRVLAARRAGGRWAFGDINIDVVYAVVYYSLELLRLCDAMPTTVGVDYFDASNVCSAPYLLTIVDAVGKWADKNASPLRTVALLTEQVDPRALADTDLVTSRIRRVGQGEHVPHVVTDCHAAPLPHLVIRPGSMSYRRAGPRSNWSG